MGVITYVPFRYFVFQGGTDEVSLHQQQSVLAPRKEKSSSPLFNPTSNDSEDGNAVLLNDGKNATNGQILRPLNSVATNKTSNGSSHNQLSAASNNNNFNRTIGSRQSSPTDDVNDIGIHQIQKGSVNENKINAINNLSNVQNSISVKNNVTKEQGFIPASVTVVSENQQLASASSHTQQINIDTGAFPGQVKQK